MLRDIHRELGIPENYGKSPAMPVFDEPVSLVPVGPNIVGKEQKLTPETALAWNELMLAAADEPCIENSRSTDSNSHDPT